jgi:L-rhamnose isomerase
MNEMKSFFFHHMEVSLMQSERKEKILQGYSLAKDRYQELGVDTENALKQLDTISLSLHCWQGDDVGGFEKVNSALSGGGIQATGNYFGKARTIQELRQDLEKALSFIPGTHRVNLHAIYGDFKGKTVDRDQITPEYYTSWIDWAKSNKLKLDFNSTCFAHPKADSGFTLSNSDSKIRKFWIDHVQKCREISAFFGKSLGSPAVHNLWIPDGMKDFPANRNGFRQILKNSLDEIFTLRYPVEQMKDAIEGKLFGIGSESFVVGSHDFYLGYAIKNNLILTMDMGHFHPTESVAEKISAILQFSNELLLHVSRGVRWDSDHVVVLNDELRSLAEEIIRCNALSRTNIALDYFDGSINRIGAWVIGARATQKALLLALLEPRKLLLEAENSSNYTKRLAILDEVKTMPFGAIWDYYCFQKNVPSDFGWTAELERYEKDVLKLR